MKNAVATPTSTSTTNRSTRKANQPWAASQPSGEPGGQRRLAVDDSDQRQEDRREEDEEAPEDEGVHEAGHEALEQLPLTEDDRRLVPHPRGELGRCGRRACPGGRGGQEPGATGRRARPRRRRSGERESRGDAGGRAHLVVRGPASAGRRRCRATRRVRLEPRSHHARASRIAAETAGTTSCRSPITA